MKKLLMISMVCALAASARADLLLAWEFTGYTGSEERGTSTYAAANMESPAYITRGFGITGAGNTNRFNATGWDNAATADDALSAGNYFEFSVAPARDYFMSITQFVFRLQRSNTGSSNTALRASFNNYASDISTLLNWAGNNVTVAWTSDVSSVTQLQNVEGAVTFRVVGWTGQSGGMMGFEGPGNDIEIHGTTTVIPEPATAMMMGLGALVTVLIRKRLSA